MVSGKDFTESCVNNKQLETQSSYFKAKKAKKLENIMLGFKICKTKYMQFVRIPKVNCLSSYVSASSIKKQMKWLGSSPNDTLQSNVQT